jgi:hypothetical protein
VLNRVITPSNSARHRALLLLSMAGLLALGGVLLLGIPGAVLFQLCTALILGPGAAQVKPDTAWPLALLISVLWPWGIPAGYWGVPRLFCLTGRKTRWCLTLLFEGLWTVTICLLFSHLAR